MLEKRTSDAHSLSMEIQKENVLHFAVSLQVDFIDVCGRITLNIELLSLRLFVGIGVDDMFVIVQAWSNLSPKEHETQPISERMGLTLQHAVSNSIL